MNRLATRTDVFGLIADEELIGCMQIVTHEMHVEIRQLHTRPDSRYDVPNRRFGGVGRALLVVARSISLDSGHEGCMSVRSTTEAAPFYERMHFEGNHLYLILDDLESQMLQDDYENAG